MHQADSLKNFNQGVLKQSQFQDPGSPNEDAAYCAIKFKT